MKKKKLVKSFQRNETDSYQVNNSNLIRFFIFLKNKKKIL